MSLPRNRRMLRTRPLLAATTLAAVAAVVLAASPGVASADPHPWIVGQPTSETREVTAPDGMGIQSVSCEAKHRRVNPWSSSGGSYAVRCRNTPFGTVHYQAWGFCGNQLHAGPIRDSYFGFWGPWSGFTCPPGVNPWGTKPVW